VTRGGGLRAGGGEGRPFRIDGPAVISFSGGRTSGLMLRRILDVGLQPDVHVLFANTGKEREETLVFVDQVARRWDVPIVWLERRPWQERYVRRAKEAAAAGFPTVSAHLRRAALPRTPTFATASRNGEPFEALIEARRFLPNPVTRFCTTELKIRPMRGVPARTDADYEALCVSMGIRS
jgi:hypothetical protein